MRAAALLLFFVGCVSAQGRLTRSILVKPSEDRQAYVRELKSKARAKNLAYAQQWLRLGHWEKSWTGSYESQADGENFFLSKDGKRHPELELDATLDGFFSELQPFDAKAPENKPLQHPRCQFPARFMWLSQQLAIDQARLPPADCSRFEDFKKSVAAESATMVFSSYYLNNPASAFGHTFLRLNKKNDEGISEDRRRLLDYGIEFSADPDTTFAPLYAIKGLIGAFPGTFRKLPYYFKVRQYNDFESRDLWEYKLKLTPAQLDVLVAHTWELGSTFFDYFYLTENCSYHLLGLVEVAAGVDLLDHVHWPVIPADAIKTMFEHDGFVEKITYRPSARTLFRYRIHDFDGDERTAVADLSEDPKTKLAMADGKERIRVIDAAQDLIDIRFAKELAKDDRESEGARRKQLLLERRAEILSQSEDLTPPVPWSKMPQLGHASRRLSIGAGADFNTPEYGRMTAGRWVSVGARIALHDLADPSDGYPELAQLEFLPMRARYDFATNDFMLEKLDLVHVLSLTSQDRFDRHTSFEFRVGSERIIDEGCNCYAGHLEMGAGLAFGTYGDRLTVFGLVHTHIWVGKDMDGIAHAPIRAGLGPGGGLRIRILPELISLTTGEWVWLPWQTGFHTWNVGTTLRWQFVRMLALDVDARLQNKTASGVVSTMLYF